MDKYRVTEMVAVSVLVEAESSLAAMTAAVPLLKAKGASGDLDCNNGGNCYVMNESRMERGQKEWEDRMRAEGKRV